MLKFISKFLFILIIITIKNYQNNDNIKKISEKQIFSRKKTFHDRYSISVRFRSPLLYIKKNNNKSIKFNGDSRILLFLLEISHIFSSKFPLKKNK